MATPAERVRVLIVHPRDPAAPTLGGIQTFLGDFIKYSPPDFQIALAGLTRDQRERPVGRWMTLDVNGRSIRFLAVAPAEGVQRTPRGLWRSANGLGRLWQALRVRERVVQLHRPYRDFVVRRHQGPTVQFIHLDLRDWPGPSGWPKLRALYREFSDRTLERMAKVYIVNEPGAEILRDEHPTIADRVEFLPVWYDEDTFHPVDQTRRDRLRARLITRLELSPQSAAGARFVLTAVRLTEIKKPLLAVEALAALLRDHEPAAHLIVAGAGELLDDARARAAELGVADRVHFLGDRPRAEIADLMQACDALLLTARSEGGGPRVVLEALACGLPVVSTTVVEVRRTVTSRVNGWLVDEPSPAALAEGLAWALGQPRSSLAAAAIAAAAPFTARRMLAGVFDTYRRLAREAHEASQSARRTAGGARR